MQPTCIWQVWVNARTAQHERFGATRITVIASDDVEAYNEARIELETAGVEVGFPISAESVRVSP